jgi:hypothetical protein
MFNLGLSYFPGSDLAFRDLLVGFGVFTRNPYPGFLNLIFYCKFLCLLPRHNGNVVFV